MVNPTLTRTFSSVYLSHLLGVRVINTDGTKLGIVKDLLAIHEERPRIIGCQLKTPGKGVQLIQWDDLIVDEEDHDYYIICRQWRDLVQPPNSVFLSKHILDKQIVDVDNKKIVRANDIRLAFLASGTYPVAVDVGTAGLLRRLGVVEFFIGLFRIFGKTIPNRLILWSNIELLSPSSRNLKLSVTQSKIHLLHPSDLSDIIEELDAKTRTAIFQTLDNEKAADVLEEMEDEAKVSLVEDLPVEKAADVLEKMPSDEVADILGEMKEEKAEQLLEEMDKATSTEVRELMEYPEDTAGALMTTEFFAFPPQSQAGAILTELRKLKPEADTIYSIYVVDEAKRLIGEVSLRDLLMAEPTVTLNQIMAKRPLFIYDKDPIFELTRLISKYTLLNVPVVDSDKTLLGAIVIDDIIHEVFKNKRVTL